MKLRAHRQTFNIPAIIHTANLPKDTVVAITDDQTVDRAGANALPVGHVLKPSRTADGSGTIESRFNSLVEVKFSGAVAAGDEVKLAAIDPTTSETRVAKWVDGTDSSTSKYGVCWKGGADGAVGEVLTY